MNVLTTLKRNARRTIGCDGAYNVAMMCCTGPVMQTFLSTLGFSSQRIYLITMLIQTVNMLTVFFCARWADTGSVIRRTRGILIPQALLFLLYLPLCLHPSAGDGAFFYLGAVCLCHAVTTGLYTVCIYKLPYVVLDATTYTRVIAVSGLLVGLTSLFSGLFLTWLAGQFSYHNIMLWGCVASCGLMIAASTLVGRQMPLEQAPQEAQSRKKFPLGSMLRQPVFYLLAPANLVRGFAYGVSSVLSVVALELGFGTQISTAMVSVQALATVGVCCLFGFVARRQNLGRLILLGSGSFLLLPLLLHSRSGFVFLAGVFVVYCGRVLVDYAIPAALRWMVPGEMAGLYQSWRMALTYCGMMLGSLTAALISTRHLMLLSAGAMILAGVSYALVARSANARGQGT